MIYKEIRIIEYELLDIFYSLMFISSESFIIFIFFGKLNDSYSLTSLPAASRHSCCLLL